MPYHTIITVPHYLYKLSSPIPHCCKASTSPEVFLRFPSTGIEEKVSFSAKSSSFWRTKEEESFSFFALLYFPLLYFVTSCLHFRFSCPHFPLKCLRYCRLHTNSCILKSLSTSNQPAPLHASVVVPPQNNGPVCFPK